MASPTVIGTNVVGVMVGVVVSGVIGVVVGSDVVREVVCVIIDTEVVLVVVFAIVDGVVVGNNLCEVPVVVFEGIEIDDSGSEEFEVQDNAITTMSIKLINNIIGLYLLNTPNLSHQCFNKILLFNNAHFLTFLKKHASAFTAGDTNIGIFSFTGTIYHTAHHGYFNRFLYFL